ncbi:hypothetical protein [Cerasicoccus arenae]|nr:hypothetical protein [Cerasicoccus arenae]
MPALVEGGVSLGNVAAAPLLCEVEAIFNENACSQTDTFMLFLA